jgi:hypothetical protein
LKKKKIFANKLCFTLTLKCTPGYFVKENRKELKIVILKFNSLLEYSEDSKKKKDFEHESTRLSG